MDELEEEVVEMDEADAELRRLRADAELRRLREEDLVEQAATQANRSNALELIWQRQRDWHAQEQQERRALQTRARQSMESLRALVLREVAGLRQQVREAEQSATALHEELPALPSLVVHPVIRRLEAKVQEQDAQWGHDVDVLRRKLKAAAFETHQLRRSLVAAQAVLDGCMAEGLASKQSINILECRIADLEGQREDQREALRKSGVRVQALDNDCSRLRDAVLQTERTLAAAHAERDALQAQLRQLSAAHQELGAQVLRHKAQVMQVSTALCQQEEAAAASNMRWQRERQGCTAARREHAATKALMAMAKTRLAAFVCEMSQLQADMLQHARDQQCVHARGEDLRRQLEAAHVAQMARVRQESADRTVAFYVQQCALDHELDLKHAEMSVITSYVQRLLLECKTQVRLTAVRQKRPPASSPQPSSPQAVAAFSVTWAREEHSNACEIQQLHQRLDKVRRHAFARQIALRHLARALRCFEEVLAGVWERRSRACGLLARSQLPCRQSMWSRFFSPHVRSGVPAPKTCVHHLHQNMRSSPSSSTPSLAFIPGRNLNVLKCTAPRLCARTMALL